MGIEVSDLTNSNDNGVFDKLLLSIQNVLKGEYAEGRITGTDYSKILLSAMDTALAQSMQFLLQKDQSAKQIEVLEAQRLLTLTQKDIALVQKSITEAELQKVEAELEFIPIQKSLLEAQVLLTQVQAAKVEIENELLELEKTKTTAEVLMVEASTSEVTKKIEVMNAQLLNIPKEGELLDKQIDKAVAETDFLAQRVKTEKSQILDNVDGVPVAGTVGKQKALYEEQAQAFVTDAEYKFAKALIETWITRRGTDESQVPNVENKLSDKYIGAAITRCFSTLDIPLPT